MVLHLVRDRGHHRLTIDPAAENAAAIRCYERAGFRRVGVMREYWRDGDGSGATGCYGLLADARRRRGGRAPRLHACRGAVTCLRASHASPRAPKGRAGPCIHGSEEPVTCL